MSKRIIFLYSLRDSGHQHAARSIKEALKSLDALAKTLDVETISFISHRLASLVYKAYTGLIEKNSKVYDYLWDNQRVYKSTNRIKKIINELNKNKFRKLFDKFNPQVVVCTQAFPCGIISNLKEDYETPFKLIGVITDYDIHSYWIYDNVDYYMVATDDMKEKLISKGTPSNRIKVTGIPVNPVFKENKDKSKLKKKLNIKSPDPIILIMGGNLGLGPISEIINELDKIDEKFQLIAVAGRNKQVRIKLKLLARKLDKPLKVYGHIDNIDELMTVSDLLITKPGGLTITEALVKKLPMVICNTIGGQETRNYKFLIDKKIVLEGKDLKDLNAIVSTFLKNPKEFQIQIKNINSFVNPDASLAIANIVLKTI